MKRILILTVLLAGCGPVTGDKPPASEEAPRTLDPWLYKDRATGCEYLSTRNESGLNPRIAADGKTHMGCKTARP